MGVLLFAPLLEDLYRTKTRDALGCSEPEERAWWRCFPSGGGHRPGGGAFLLEEDTGLVEVLSFWRRTQHGYIRHNGKDEPRQPAGVI
ncbi:hypothetical protein CgunFtcFv8_013703 [Champsocephalus gunnari]|uniref:Uncharacterized protein n=1 Tax=Champsocephalus gunnari TaxID=52237 RepID=A0AAN8HU03_CHAGU|nr:hypothetical protein CgunFtcFv8_013703 [Champsocephalus gunnari]